MFAPAALLLEGPVDMSVQTRSVLEKQQATEKSQVLQVTDDDCVQVKGVVQISESSFDQRQMTDCVSGSVCPVTPVTRLSITLQQTSSLLFFLQKCVLF